MRQTILLFKKLIRGPHRKCKHFSKLHSVGLTLVQSLETPASPGLPTWEAASLVLWVSHVGGLVGGLLLLVVTILATSTSTPTSTSTSTSISGGCILTTLVPVHPVRTIWVVIVHWGSLPRVHQGSKGVRPSAHRIVVHFGDGGSTG